MDVRCPPDLVLPTAATGAASLSLTMNSEENCEDLRQCFMDHLSK